MKEDENGLVAPVKEHIFAVVKRWMDPNNDGNPEDGIDGWRLDVAEMVHHNFWKQFRSYVKSINPEAYLTGEILWEDWANYKFMDPQPWLKGDQFDGVMNYRWSVAMSDFFIDNEKKITAGKFADRLYDLDQSYHPDTRYQLLNLMDSHDTDRLSSHIVNPDLFFDKMVALNDNPSYDIRKQNEQEWQILKLIVTVQMTMPGAPMIYYGSEAGMWGADDPSVRKPMIWPEFSYWAETENISLTPRPVDSVSFDSTVNAGAAYWVKDIYHQYINPAATEKQLMSHSRWSSVALVVLGLGFMLLINNINEIWGWITSSLGAGLLIPTLTRWYWWRMNGYGFAAGTAAGMIAAVLQRLFLPEIPEYYAFMVATIASLIGMIIGTYSAPPTDEKVLLEFYKRTRPFGFWGPVRKKIAAETLSQINLENRRDILSTFLAVPWQVVLFLTGMAVILKRWDQLHGWQLCW